MALNAGRMLSSQLLNTERNWEIATFGNSNIAPERSEQAYIFFYLPEKL